jgi:transcriptional regulator with XRE-family HTH domain
VTTTTDKYDQIWRSLASDGRDGFVEAEIVEALSAQILVMREARGWSRADLAQRAGLSPATIRRLEDPNRATYSVDVLLRLAAAFDVGLQVRFVPFSRLVDAAADLSLDDLAVPSVADDAPHQSTAPAADSRGRNQSTYPAAG